MIWVGWAIGLGVLFGIPAWAAQTQAESKVGKVWAVILAIAAVAAWLAIMLLS